MRVVRFYDMMIDVLSDGQYTTEKLNQEFTIELSKDFDLNDAFSILNERSGCDVCSFSYEEISHGS